MESSSVEADVAEIALIISPGFTYEPHRPEGWTYTPSWRSGRIYLTRAVLNEMINYCVRSIGLDASKLPPTLGSPDSQIVDHFATKELANALERLGAGRAQIQVKIFALGRAKKELVMRQLPRSMW